MHFCIFSFNRGQFLRHCIESIEQCAPGCAISIYDDNSDDPETRQQLEALAARHRVVTPSRGKEESKHGGLYANMQRALDDQAPGTVVCFLQDDMQLVRALSEEELAEIEARFSDSARPPLLHPAFLKGSNRERDLREVRFSADDDGYYCDRYSSSAGAHYSDVLIASVDGLRRLNWRFGQRESENEQQARGKLPQMLYLRNPFAAWLPNVPAWRGKTRTLGLSWAQRLSRCDFYPLRIMPEQARQQFMSRSSDVLPVAEDFLTLEEGRVPTPWQYHPLQGRRLLKWLDSAERRLGKIGRG